MRGVSFRVNLLFLFSFFPRLIGSSPLFFLGGGDHEGMGGGGGGGGVGLGGGSLNAQTEKHFTDQIQHLSNLLSDSEDAIERLLSQEKVLKTEIRRLDSLEGLQNAQLP